MKLILQGYSGKMGSIVHAYLKSKNHEFVQLLDQFNQDVSIEALINCDAIIDFSNPKSSLRLFSYALKYHKPMIIGTTGFSKSELDEICSLNDIESLGKKIKIVENVKNELGLNANMKLLFDKLIIELSEV